MSEESQEFLFTRENYILLIAGLLIVLIGFVLMAGGGSEDPNVFSEEIFSARRITVAPTLCLVGYGIVMWSIFKRPAKDQA